MRKMYVIVLILFFALPVVASQRADTDDLRVLRIKAATKEERTQIASLGISIEDVDEHVVIALAYDDQVKALAKGGFEFSLQTLPAFLADFPPEDSDFHSLDELTAELEDIAEKSEVAALSVIGQSIEGRPLQMMRISGAGNQEGAVPGIVFLGTHHAREHLSTEVPFFLIRYLVENYGVDPTVTDLIDTREIWIMPMVNPDGAHYDVEAPSYKWWRKNRRGDENTGEVFGVDLNRNYGYQWGGPGSGTSRYAMTYRGAAPFSEPETLAVKNFLESRNNITVLLSYHTFSELILYPWGHTYDSISVERDRRVHEVLARKMGEMTGYQPQQSSNLYLASGDTTDWAYGMLGIFSFTFELFPASLEGGGFYPSASHIQDVVRNNIPPALYLIAYADNPCRVLDMPHESVFIRANKLFPETWH